MLWSGNTRRIDRVSSLRDRGCEWSDIGRRKRRSSDEDKDADEDEDEEEDALDENADEEEEEEVEEEEEEEEDEEEEVAVAREENADMNEDVATLLVRTREKRLPLESSLTGPVTAILTKGKTAVSTPGGREHSPTYPPIPPPIPVFEGLEEEEVDEEGDKLVSS